MIDHKNLVALRKQQRLSQTQVARKLNMTQSAYGKIERGKTRLRADLLADLSKIFKVQPSSIIEPEYSNKVSPNLPRDNAKVVADQKQILMIYIESIENLVLSKYSDIMINFDGVALDYENFPEVMVKAYRETYNINSAEEYYASEDCPIPYEHTDEEQYAGFVKLMNDRDVYSLFDDGLFNYDDDPTFSKCWKKFQKKKSLNTWHNVVSIPPEIIKNYSRMIKLETGKLIM